MEECATALDPPRFCMDRIFGPLEDAMAIAIAFANDWTPPIISFLFPQRSSSGVNPSGPDVELISASVGEDGVMRVRGRRELASWPADGSSAMIWATGPVDGDVEAPNVMYHGTSHAPGGTTATVVLAAAQNTCTEG